MNLLEDRERAKVADQQEEPEGSDPLLRGGYGENQKSSQGHGYSHSL